MWHNLFLVLYWNKIILSKLPSICLSPLFWTKKKKKESCSKGIYLFRKRSKHHVGIFKEYFHTWVLLILKDLNCWGWGMIDLAWENVKRKAKKRRKVTAFTISSKFLWAISQEWLCEEKYDLWNNPKGT